MASVRTIPWTLGGVVCTLARGLTMTYFLHCHPILATAVKPAATPKCMVNLAAALFCCARIYSALWRSSAGLSPAFTKPIFFFFLCLTYTYKQEQGNKSKGNIY